MGCQKCNKCFYTQENGCCEIYKSIPTKEQISNCTHSEDYGGKFSNRYGIMTGDFVTFLRFTASGLAHIIGFFLGLIGGILSLPTLGWSLKPFHLWKDFGIKVGLFENDVYDDYY